MENKSLRLRIANIIGIISISIPAIIFMFILNWFFKITPYQELQGLPLMITPLICPIAIVLAIISRIILANKFWKISVISNIFLFLLPFLYWYLGTIFFGV